MDILKIALAVTASLGITAYLTRRNLRRRKSAQDESPAIYSNLLEALQPAWGTSISPVLLQAFGEVATFYAILYQGESGSCATAEIWDPDRDLPSQVFRLEGISKEWVRRLPGERNQARVVVLDKAALSPQSNK